MPVPNYLYSTLLAIVGVACLIVMVIIWQGYGTALLKWVIDYYRESGARQLEVGTGTFGYQLAFYQRNGFRVTSIDRDFFIQHYPEPIFEDGIQLFDMLRLTLRYSGDEHNNSFAPTL